MIRAFARALVTALVLCVAAPPALAADADDTQGDRIFGVLPNYTTVDTTSAPRETTSESFRLARLSTFDPVIFPFVGATVAIGQGPSGKNYGERYATVFADNAIGNFMTTAVVPSLTNQDSRYYRRGEGSVMSRLAYAASRSLVTRTRSGSSTFNISEVAGTAAAAGVSNMYYPAADRTLSATAARWGTQMLWDAVANELKEFWPDVRSRIRRHAR